MGRGLVLAIALAVVSLLGMSACQALYGGRPEKLRNPEKKKRPADLPDAVVEVKYVEDCNADFRGDPTKAPRPQPAIANQLLDEGTNSLATSEKSKDPSAQAEGIRIAIDKFRNALIKDPYNQDATLQLAIAYDKVYRKGCALAMLKRLAALQGNPKYAKAANLAADRVTDNTQWFKGYRKDAVAAVGR